MIIKSASSVYQTETPTDSKSPLTGHRWAQEVAMAKPRNGITSRTSAAHALAISNVRPLLIQGSAKGSVIATVAKQLLARLAQDEFDEISCQAGILRIGEDCGIKNQRLWLGVNRMTIGSVKRKISLAIP